MQLLAVGCPSRLNVGGDTEVGVDGAPDDVARLDVEAGDATVLDCSDPLFFLLERNIDEDVVARSMDKGRLLPFVSEGGRVQVCPALRAGGFVDFPYSAHALSEREVIIGGNGDAWVIDVKNDVNQRQIEVNAGSGVDYILDFATVKEKNSSFILIVVSDKQDIRDAIVNPDDTPAFGLNAFLSVPRIEDGAATVATFFRVGSYRDIETTSMEPDPLDETRVLIAPTISQMSAVSRLTHPISSEPVTSETLVNKMGRAELHHLRSKISGGRVLYLLSGKEGDRAGFFRSLSGSTQLAGPAYCIDSNPCGDDFRVKDTIHDPRDSAHFLMLCGPRQSEAISTVVDYDSSDGSCTTLFQEVGTPWSALEFVVPP